ncbi:hypothetical protein [Paraburkholderia sp. D1E]|uniref:hypothetical protein n=1 Tax=Paraburkholderia sp. D1E TaxID=3461398 RepID=UPI004045E956
MDIWEIRLANMRLLAEKEGSNAALARKLGLATSQMHAYIGRHPIKRITDAPIERATKAFNLPHGWFDVPQVAGLDGKPVELGVWPFLVERARFDALPAIEKERIGRFIKDTVETWEAANAAESDK